MHEAALAAPLLRVVLEEAERHAGQQKRELAVTRVRVRAGLLTGIEAPTLSGVFSLMAEGTAAHGATLTVEPEPMKGSCPDCGAQDFAAVKRDFHCPVCGGDNADWQGGNELYIASIDVAPAHTASGA